MKTSYIFLYVFIILISCREKDRRAHETEIEYENGRQLLTLNERTSTGKPFPLPEVDKIMEDSVFIGDELVVRIFLKESRLKIVNAFVDCDASVIHSVDTTTLDVAGCKDELFLQKDTIYIGFRPREIGLKQFPEIKILTKDDLKVFRTLDYSFSYKVVD